MLFMVDLLLLHSPWNVIWTAPSLSGSREHSSAWFAVTNPQTRTAFADKTSESSEHPSLPPPAPHDSELLLHGSRLPRHPRLFSCGRSLRLS